MTERGIERRPPTLQRQLDEFRRRAEDVEAIATDMVAQAYEDDSRLSLQIRLRDDRVITLTHWKDARFGSAPSVTLSSGTWGYDFGSNKNSIDDLREWAGRALGFITAAPGACVDCEFDTFNGEFYIVQDAIWKAACEASPQLAWWSRRAVHRLLGSAHRPRTDAR